MDLDASQADLTTALLFGRPRRAGVRVAPPAGSRGRRSPRALSADAGAIFIPEKGALKFIENRFLWFELVEGLLGLLAPRFFIRPITGVVDHESPEPCLAVVGRRPDVDFGFHPIVSRAPVAVFLISTAVPGYSRCRRTC